MCYYRRTIINYTVQFTASMNLKYLDRAFPFWDYPARGPDEVTEIGLDASPRPTECIGCE